MHTVQRERGQRGVEGRVVRLEQPPVLLRNEPQPPAHVHMHAAIHTCPYLRGGRAAGEGMHVRARGGTQRTCGIEFI